MCTKKGPFNSPSLTKVANMPLKLVVYQFSVFKILLWNTPIVLTTLALDTFGTASDLKKENTENVVNNEEVKEDECMCVKQLG